MAGGGYWSDHLPHSVIKKYNSNIDCLVTRLDKALVVSHVLLIKHNHFVFIYKIL